ncbi:hypothetical protein HPL003_00630 [Paenibacillus terrae HPL-003]|uniref:Uncharacterized protein n=1 Tax=Paenibacillus terrae (strain HPL-003) TaxID=985665 RepID=G7VUB3_PAETH|nr:hypothetical protein HPL003_00630 [Paenibacillus terrae HPL-003]
MLFMKERGGNVMIQILTYISGIFIIVSVSRKRKKYPIGMTDHFCQGSRIILIMTQLTRLG